MVIDKKKEEESRDSRKLGEFTQEERLEIIRRLSERSINNLL